MLSIQIERIYEKCGEFSKLMTQNFYLELHQVVKNCVMLRQRHSVGGSLRANARRSGALNGGHLLRVS